MSQDKKSVPASTKTVIHFLNSLHKKNMIGTVKKHPVLTQLSATGAPADQALIAQTIEWDVNRREMLGEGQKLMAPHGDVSLRDVVKGQLIFRVVPENEDVGSTVVPYYISCFNGVVDRNPDESLEILKKQFEFVGTARRNLTVSTHNLQTEPTLAIQVGGHTVIWNNSTDVTFQPGDIITWDVPDRVEGFDGTLEVAQSLPTIGKLSQTSMEKIVGECIYELITHNESLPLNYLIPVKGQNLNIQPDIELALTVKQFVGSLAVKVSVLLHALGIQTLQVPGALASDVTDAQIEEMFADYLAENINLDNLPKTRISFNSVTKKLAVTGTVGTDTAKQEELRRVANFMGKIFDLATMFAPDVPESPVNFIPELSAMLFSKYNTGGPGKANASMSKILGISTNTSNGTTDVTSSVVKACDSASDIFNVAYDFYRNIAKSVIGKATTTSLPGTEVGVIIQ